MSGGRKNDGKGNVNAARSVRAACAQRANRNEQETYNGVA